MDSAAGGEASIKSLQICRGEMQHEYTILSNRLSSYITSQSFLTTGYAVSMGNAAPVWGPFFRAAIPTTLCVLGLVLSARAMPGIGAACRIVQLWHVRQDEILATGDFSDYSVMRSEEYHKLQKNSLVFSKAAVWAFAAGWFVFLGVALYVASVSLRSGIH